MRYLLISIALTCSIACAALASPDRRAGGPPESGHATFAPARPGGDDAGPADLSASRDGLTDPEEDDPDDGLSRGPSQVAPSSPDPSPLATSARISIGLRASIFLTRLRC